MDKWIENHIVICLKAITGLKGESPFSTKVVEEVGEVVDKTVGTCGEEVGGGAVAVGDTAGADVGVASHEDVDGHVAYY